MNLKTKSDERPRTRTQAESDNGGKEADEKSGMGPWTVRGRRESRGLLRLLT